MADPLVAPALVGGAVSILMQEAIKACKGAIRLKESCQTLKSKVDDISPLFTAARAHFSGNWDTAATAWSKKFEDILQDAKTVANQIIEESKYQKCVRGMRFWKWRKLSKRVSAINARIDEARSNYIFIRHGTSPAPTATSSRVEFVMQPIPPLVVGGEEIFKKLKSSVMASFGRDKASYLAVRARGGAGKTTLARQLHNDEDIQSTYGCESILWITVGSDARIHDIYKTMSNFLDDQGFQVYHATMNLEDQRSYLMSAFAKRKVFMILDDVWSKAYEYHTMIYWLALATTHGSTTLVTSRSKGILSNIGMDSSSTQGALMSSSVHVEEEVVLMLSQENSWKLFCFCAFQAGTLPPSIEEELAREVCEECKGLPLALKVIGSAMREKKDLGEWQRALRDLQRSRPISDSNVDDELYNRLRLSYNELKRENLRRCFLYCAAFPEDYEIEVYKLVEMWKIEGLVDGEDEAKSNLETLVKRSMVDWHDNMKLFIVVHDVLRDLAFYIIDMATFGDGAWNYIFQSGKEVTRLDNFKSLEVVTTMSLIGSRVLQWPRTLATPHLRVLMLSEMRGLLQIPHHIFSGLRALQYLDLSLNQFDEHHKLPSFEGLVGLLKLELNNCQDLDELPESIGELESLLELDLEGCSMLEEIPKSIGNLKCLTSFDASRCTSLNELPESIGELKSLVNLDISLCNMLKTLPKSIGELKFLKYLDLSMCESLVELPESLGKLESLFILNLSYCKMLEKVPMSIGELRSLKELDIEGCEALVELPKSIGKMKSLRHLDFHGCSLMEKVPQSILEMKGL